mmetsp:Transcript_104812/g.333501  ORF Transcript_104812/g.333501 Transcript_104812/m.333501 type:complete len:262 (-) Transcript_104812:2-787(-)
MTACSASVQLCVKVPQEIEQEWTQELHPHVTPVRSSSARSSSSCASRAPARAANSSGSLCSPSRRRGSARASNSSATHRGSPARAAQCRGVRPSSQRRFGDAFACNRNSRSRGQPRRAATCRGGWPRPSKCHSDSGSRATARKAASKSSSPWTAPPFGRVAALRAACRPPLGAWAPQPGKSGPGSLATARRRHLLPQRASRAHAMGPSSEDTSGASGPATVAGEAPPASEPPRRKTSSNRAVAVSPWRGSTISRASLEPRA